MASVRRRYSWGGKTIYNNRNTTHIRLVTGQNFGVQEGRDGQTVGARLFLVTGPSAVDAVPFVLHGYNNIREINLQNLSGTSVRF